MTNILEKIINKKKERLNEIKKKVSVDGLKDKINENNLFFDFKDKIKKNILKEKISLIAEIKKASPSAGIIINDYNPVDLAKKYNEYNATCLSVLTEEDFFQGNLIHLSKIKKSVHLPILCKDFFIDPFQVYLAKSYGADAILIILSAVTDDLAKKLYENALKLNMSVIIEVHTRNEAKKAIEFKDALIGINNRNLKTLKTDMNITYDIHDILINHHQPLISESGIKSKEDLLKIKEKTKIKTFLIGESLLKNIENNPIFSLL